MWQEAAKIFGKVMDVVTGGAVSTIVDMVKDYFPPSMSEAEKAELSLKIAQADHQRNLEIMRIVDEARQEWYRFTQEMEGTASDLKIIPLIGPLVIFLRGVQRPLWGFITLYFDWVYLAQGGANYTEKQALLLLVINVIVLSVLFGERAVKNLMPLLMTVFGGKKGN